MTESPRQRPTWLRGSAVFVAVFLLLGVEHVLPALHFALVAHKLCAEHGELLHAGTGEEVLPFHLASSPDAALTSAPGSDAHEHEHCGVLALPASVGPVEALSGVACVLPPSWTLHLPGRERLAHVEIALLLYAPKLAPPV